MLEFFVIHASGFLMWPWLTRWGVGRRALYVGALAVGYTAVLGGIALGVGAWWPFTIFWGLMANRMLGAVLELPGPDDVDRLAQPWAGATTLFVVVVMGVGLMGPARRAVLAGGGVYFLLVALSELSGWRWVERWMTGARRRAGHG